MKRTIAIVAAAVIALASGACAQRHNTLTRAQQDDGWTLLFDGRSTEHFRGYRRDAFPQQGWGVVDGTLRRLPGPAGGDIVTRQQYEDFEFVCQWLVTPGANSGIIYRCTEDKENSWETGLEHQILDDDAHRDGAAPKTRAGSLYDLVAPAHDAVRPAGQWNEARIVARGPHIRHYLNGALIVDIRLDSDEYRHAHAQSKWPGMPDFGTRARGHIALQDHGDEVWFRNIRVRELPRASQIDP